MTQLNIPSKCIPYTKIDTLSEGIKYSWTCSILDNVDYKIDVSSSIEPKAGAIALVRVEQIDYHNSIVTIDNKIENIWRKEIVDYSST